MIEPSPIDLVYTWVDGADPDFAASLKKSKDNYEARKGAPPEQDGTGAHRFRDLDNLRYSLRSVEQNAPWVSRIFIVTNGQVPAWLNKSSHVHVVAHEEIFPEREHLPTFNASAIEMNLHRIPGLARFFLYLNDDLFFTRRTSPDYFFGNNGLPKILFAPWGLDPNPNQSIVWYRTLANLARLLNERFGPNHKWYQSAHGPTLFDRFELERVHSMWPELVMQTSRQPFREATDLQLHTLYANTLAALDAASGKDPAERHEKLTVHANDLRIISVGDPKVPWRDHLLEVIATPPRFLCLNDNVPFEISDAMDFSEIEATHRRFLQTLFPAPSIHEPPAASAQKLPGGSSRHPA